MHLTPTEKDKLEAHGLTPPEPKLADVLAYAEYLHSVVQEIAHWRDVATFAQFLEARVSVDYAPCRILAEAAQAAGMDAGRFPWKTTMWIDWKEQRVRVGHGYRAPIVELSVRAKRDPSKSQTEHYADRTGKEKP